jgi:hypothetical protein
MLAASQFVQLFGKSLENGELHILDWAQKPFTCSQEDRACAGATHRDYAAAAPSVGCKCAAGQRAIADPEGARPTRTIRARPRLPTVLMCPHPWRLPIAS